MLLRHSDNLLEQGFAQSCTGWVVWIAENVRTRSNLDQATQLDDDHLGAWLDHCFELLDIQVP